MPHGQGTEAASRFPMEFQDEFAGGAHHRHGAELHDAGCHGTGALGCTMECRQADKGTRVTDAIAGVNLISAGRAEAQTKGHRPDDKAAGVFQPIVPMR